MNEKEDSIWLTPEDLQTLRRKQAVIEAQKEVVMALQQSFIRLLEDNYGINIEEENWHLDLETGELRHEEG